MNTENEMNEEVRQLLDSLEEHGKNARRQKELGDLIDRLADEEKAVAMPHKHRTLTPLWWAMGAAAACLLLWLLVKPSEKKQPEMEQKILVEETKTLDSVKTEVNDVVFEQPVANETYLAEETTVVPQNAPMKKEKSKTQIIEEVVVQPMLAEVKPTEPHDTTNIGSNTIPTENETPSAVQKPQRRVIRSFSRSKAPAESHPEPQPGVLRMSEGPRILHQTCHGRQNLIRSAARPEHEKRIAGLGNQI